MKVVSFNIRCDYNQDDKNNFLNRKQYILDRIDKEQPDIIGFQEVLPHVQKWLRSELKDYMVVGCGRDKELLNEHMSLALKRESVELYGLSHFWLSKTPQIPGSRYEEQSTCPRLCTEAIIKIERIKTPILVYNTHLDHEGVKARILGLKQILERMKEQKKQKSYPSILMGDFNAKPESEELKLIESYPDLALQDVSKDLGITFHDYGKKSSFCKIDYLFISQEFQCDFSYLWKECHEGIYLSDHYPVAADIRLK